MISTICLDENYTTAKGLATALNDRHVHGVLVDAYTAGISKDDFSHSKMRATYMIKYPRTYGFVLSGQLKNVADEVRDFIKVNEGYIHQLIENTTVQIMVSLSVHNENEIKHI